MDYWIINHQYKSYQEYNDIIGIPAKINKETGKPRTDKNGNRMSKYELIPKKGDKFIYYCPAPKKFVLGIFKILEGPTKYEIDWNLSVHYKIEPILTIKEENRISYYTLVKLLDFFKDEEGNWLYDLNRRSAAIKLRGTIKPIDYTDFERVEKLITRSEPTPPSKSPSEIKPHIEMIKTTHLQAARFRCASYIGSKERSQTINSLTVEEEEEQEAMDELPEWMINIAEAIGAKSRISNIDNIWFMEESRGFYIPFAIFEHERSEDLRGVMDRFNALDRLLDDNERFNEIKPLYFIIGENQKQITKYEKYFKNTRHGEWASFRARNKITFLSIDEIKSRKYEYDTLLAEHLKNIRTFFPSL